MENSTTLIYSANCLYDFRAVSGAGGLLNWQQGEQRLQDPAESRIVINQYSPAVQKNLPPGQKVQFDLLAEQNRVVKVDKYDEDDVDTIPWEKSHGWTQDVSLGDYFWFNFSPKHKQAAITVPTFFQVIVSVDPMQYDFTFGSDNIIKVEVDTVDVLDKAQVWFESNVVPNDYLTISATAFGYLKEKASNYFITVRVWIHHGFVEPNTQLQWFLNRTWTFIHTSLGVQLSVKDTYDGEKIEDLVRRRAFRGFPLTAGASGGLSGEVIEEEWVCVP